MFDIIEGQYEELNTLNESILETLYRDLRFIFVKLGYVLYPRGGSRVEALRNWDLWGPLFFCIVLAFSISFQAESDSRAFVFNSTFVVVCLGSALVTVNAVLLGANISFVQVICALGYCLFPSMLAAILCILFHNMYMRALLAITAFAWSLITSIDFISGSAPPNKKIIVVYPLVLFQFVLSWLIFVQ